MRPLSRNLIIAAALALVVSACSDDPSATTTTSIGTTVTSATTDPTTTATAGDFVFGSGVIPETVPDDFPIANGAVIDTTLVNTLTGFTEVAIIIPAELDIAALFFEQNLQARGYEFDATSVDQGRRWTITFSKDGVDGSIDIASANAGVSRATVTIPGSG